VIDFISLLDRNTKSSQTRRFKSALLANNSKLFSVGAISGGSSAPVASVKRLEFTHFFADEAFQANLGENFFTPNRPGNTAFCRLCTDISRFYEKKAARFIGDRFLPL
jgi:hypothetical protein